MCFELKRSGQIGSRPSTARLFSAFFGSQNQNLVFFTLQTGSNLLSDGLLWEIPNDVLSSGQQGVRRDSDSFLFG